MNAALSLSVSSRDFFFWGFAVCCLHHFEGVSKNSVCSSRIRYFLAVSFTALSVDGFDPRLGSCMNGGVVVGPRGEVFTVGGVWSDCHLDPRTVSDCVYALAPVVSVYSQFDKS